MPPVEHLPKARALSLAWSFTARYDSQRDRALPPPREPPMSEPLPAQIHRVDPGQAWEPWKPEARDPWSARWAGHLLRRAAFGASPEQIARASRDGVEPTIKQLLEGTPGHQKTDALLARIGQRVP